MVRLVAAKFVLAFVEPLVSPGLNRHLVHMGRDRRSAITKEKCGILFKVTCNN